MSLSIDEARRKLAAFQKRTNDVAVEYRATADGQHITGHAIVFGVHSLDLGGFQEIIRPEAVDRTLREALDVRALIDHDSAKVIGRTSAGTLSLRKESRGLFVTIDPPKTTAATDLIELIRRRDVTGMSFGFRTLKDDWHMEGDTPIRSVLDMSIREVSVVSFPAYPQTSVSYRTAASHSQIARLQRQLDAAMRGDRGMSVDWAEKLHRTKLALLHA
jgi:HK97 family phage prohead protease